MPSIALCDDDPKALEHLKAMLAAYRLPGGETLHVVSFASPVKLIEHLDKRGLFDAYFLDVIMPDAPFQGIEAGRRIHEHDDEACIVYLTVSPDFALEAYKTHPFDYLLKPVDRKRLNSVLDKALARATRVGESSIVIRSDKGLLRIVLDDIIFAETAGRAVRYRLREGKAALSRTRRASFKVTTAPLLESGRFVATSSSHAVNLRHIESMGKATLRMDDGTVLPLTRLHADEARRAWLSQWLPEDDGPDTTDETS